MRRKELRERPVTSPLVRHGTQAPLDARVRAPAVAQGAQHSELRKVVTEGLKGLRACSQLGAGQSSLWMAEAELAVVESKAEEQAEAAWSEAFQHQLAAKKQRQPLDVKLFWWSTSSSHRFRSLVLPQQHLRLRVELELQERRRFERLRALEVEKIRVIR